jgi:LAO/AO transport system kinase
VLGDRIRLSEHFLDPGVFIRSMATRGALGGLAEAATQATLLMDAAGFDDVLLETVGVGQAEVDVVSHADAVVLVLTPGAGDSVQALKAGVMEIPDVIVVNKADHPLADTLVRQIGSVLSLAPREERRVPIVKTEAVRGDGVDKLLDALQRHRSSIAQEGSLAERRRRNLMNEVLALAGARLQAALAAAVRDDPAVQELLDAVVARRIDPASAARAILRDPDALLANMARAHLEFDLDPPMIGG